MARKFQHKRGLKVNLPNLSPAEMALTTDEKKLYFGDGNENIRLLDQKDKTEITTQLSDNVIVNQKRPLVSKVKTGAVVSFIDDDGMKEVLSRWKPIADSKGIKISLAISPGNLNKDTTLSTQQLKQLKNEGFDILSHGYVERAMSTSTPEIIRSECSLSKKWFLDNGFGEINTLVYGGGMNSNDVSKKNIVREYYDFGVNNHAGMNTGVFDNLYIARIDTDFETVARLKNFVDQAVLNGSWIVFLSHCWRQQGTIEQMGVFNTERITQLIDYVQSLNVPIMTFTEASKFKGNIIQAGEFTDPNTVVIKATGESKFPSDYSVIDSSVSDIDASITTFPLSKMSIKLVSGSRDTYYNKGGVLQTFRSKEKHFSYQMYKVYDDSGLYIRRWNESVTPNAWGQFISIYPSVQNPTSSKGFQNFDNVSGEINPNTTIIRVLTNTSPITLTFPDSIITDGASWTLVDAWHTNPITIKRKSDGAVLITDTVINAPGTWEILSWQGQLMAYQKGATPKKT